MGTIQDELMRVSGSQIVDSSQVAGQAVEAARPAPGVESLAAFASNIQSLCERDIDELTELVARLDKYTPSRAESNLASGKSYKALKTAVLVLKERLVQTRRLSSEISK